MPCVPTLPPTSLRSEVLLCLRRGRDTRFPWKAERRQERFYTNKAEFGRDVSVPKGLVRIWVAQLPAKPAEIFEVLQMVDLVDEE